MRSVRYVVTPQPMSTILLNVAFDQTCDMFKATFNGYAVDVTPLKIMVFSYNQGR